MHLRSNGYYIIFLVIIGLLILIDELMRGLEVDGILYEVELEIQDQVVGFYESLYQE